MRTLRICLRVLQETVIGLRRSGWSNWLVVSILAVALTIFGGVLQTTMAIKVLVSSWGSQLEISAYLKENFEPQKVCICQTNSPGELLAKYLLQLHFRNTQHLELQRMEQSSHYQIWSFRVLA